MRVFAFGQTIAPFFKGTGPNFPDHDLESLDDEQVKGVMLQVGATELLTDSPPHWGPSPKGEADIRGLVFKKHPTHYFLFIRWEHSTNPGDNGFALWGLARSKHSNADFVRFVQKWFEDQRGPRTPPEIKYYDLPEDLNERS